MTGRPGVERSSPRTRGSVPVSRRLVAVALLSTALVLSLLVSPAEAAMPSKKRWVSDTYKEMLGSRAYVGDRVAKGGSKLAINLDIDNTALATFYDAGTPVAATLRLARHADAKGVSILFNTGRRQGRLTPIVGALRRAGYPIDGLCSRKRGRGWSRASSGPAGSTRPGGSRSSPTWATGARTSWEAATSAPSSGPTTATAWVEVLG